MGKSGLVKERCKALDFNYWRFGFKDNSHEINVVNSLMAIIIQREPSGNSTRRDDRVYRQHRPMNFIRERDYLILRIGGSGLLFLEIGHIALVNSRRIRRVPERVQTQLLPLANYAVLATSKMCVRHSPTTEL